MNEIKEYTEKIFEDIKHFDKNSNEYWYARELMMVRDRGHALTIEITINNQMARLEYFILKLCNLDMINNLPGINKVNENSVWATGTFEIPIIDLPNELFTFISKVPMDDDMVVKY